MLEPQYFPPHAQMVLESIEASRSGTEFCAIRVMLDARDEGGLPYSTPELLDNVMTLLFAGHDTSATAMLCLLEEMRKHPEGVQALRAEQAGWSRGEAPV